MIGKSSGSPGTMVDKPTKSFDLGTLDDDPPRLSGTLSEYNTESYKDMYGVLWYQFVCDYSDNDVSYTFQIWATDIEDAERRMGLIKQNCKVAGQLIGVVDA